MNTQQQLELPLSTNGDPASGCSALDCHHTYMTFSTAWGATIESAHACYIKKYGQEPETVFQHLNHLIFAGPVPEGV